MNGIEHEYALQGQVTEIDSTNGKASLLLENDRIIQWPLDKLPADIQVGAELSLICHDKKTAEQERQRIAKRLLNEIFIFNE